MRRVLEQLFNVDCFLTRISPRLLVSLVPVGHAIKVPEEKGHDQGTFDSAHQEGLVLNPYQIRIRLEIIMEVVQVNYSGNILAEKDEKVGPLGHQSLADLFLVLPGDKENKDERVIL